MKQRVGLIVGAVIALGVTIVVAMLVLGVWLRSNREEVVAEETDEELVEQEELPEEKEPETEAESEEIVEEPEVAATVSASASTAASAASPINTGNCTTGWGNLMLINPNFTVGTDYIAARRQDLISVSAAYGIPEYNRGTNGDNLLTPEAAEKLNAMVRAYEADNPGHTMGTRSCFRVRGTSCGRLCAATGASDHHSGLTCDLIDTQYGTALDTDDYARHKEWQWLKENSYKYGFIDRFPITWAGGSMSAPLNVDGNGTTGLYETWHYRYVGVEAAMEIATGKYNGGSYDSLEHYLKATGKISDLKNGICAK